MIISDHKKFMFLHNPKAAGTSVRRALFEHDTNEFMFEYQRFIPQLDRVIELFHVCAADIPAVWPRLDLSEYFTFGFTRHPYDRLFSAWDEYRRQHPEMRNADFNEWAMSNLTRANVRYDWEFTHFCPQHYFFYVGNKCIADYIGKYENLVQDWIKICRLAKIEHKPMGHEKKHAAYELPDRLNYSDIHSDVMQRVNDIYEMDFVLFNYMMHGEVSEKNRHLHVIESNTHPHVPYRKYEDVRNMSVPEQAGYWRTRAQESEAKWGFYQDQIIHARTGEPMK